MEGALRYLVYGLILWAGMKTYCTEPPKPKPKHTIAAQGLQLHPKYIEKIFVQRELKQAPSLTQ